MRGVDDVPGYRGSGQPAVTNSSAPQLLAPATISLPPPLSPPTTSSHPQIDNAAQRRENEQLSAMCAELMARLETAMGGAKA